MPCSPEAAAAASTPAATNAWDRAWGCERRDVTAQHITEHEHAQHRDQLPWLAQEGGGVGPADRDQQSGEGGQRACEQCLQGTGEQAADDGDDQERDPASGVVARMSQVD